MAKANRRAQARADHDDDALIARVVRDSRRTHGLPDTVADRVAIARLTRLIAQPGTERRP